MLGFFSVGFDAAISHNFQELREGNPSLFSSVTLNKARHYRVIPGGFWGLGSARGGGGGVNRRWC